MKPEYTRPVPLADAMHIPEMVQLVEDLKTGKVVPCSPFPGMGEAVFTQEQLDASHAFLLSLQARLLARKAQAVSTPDRGTAEGVASDGGAG